jgi:hypothetical protein
MMTPSVQEVMRLYPSGVTSDDNCKCQENGTVGKWDSQDKQGRICDAANRLRASRRLLQPRRPTGSQRAALRL